MKMLDWHGLKNCPYAIPCYAVYFDDEIELAPNGRLPVRTLERMLEIIDSMREEPYLEVNVFNEANEFSGGVPSLKAYAKAKNGVCLYAYEHSGLIGLKEAKEKLLSRAKGVKPNEY